MDFIAWLGGTDIGRAGEQPYRRIVYVPFAQALSPTPQIYALWSITEWQLQNIDKFRNQLTKGFITEDEQVTWVRPFLPIAAKP
jgi:hypothetical protein